MTKREVQRAHDFLDAFEAEVAEQGRRAIDSGVAGPLHPAVPAAWRRARAVWGCFLLHHPEAMEYEGAMGRILVRLAPFIARRAWDSDTELARLIVAIYLAVEEGE